MTGERQMKTDTGRLSRRRLIAGAAAGCAVAMAAIAAKQIGVGPRPGPLPRPRTPARNASLATAEMEEWEGLVGSLFSVGGYRARLVGLQPFPVFGARPPHLRRRAFAALFEPTTTVSLPGDLIYPVAHASYPPLELFLARSTSTAHPLRMQALFN